MGGRLRRWGLAERPWLLASAGVISLHFTLLRAQESDLAFGWNVLASVGRFLVLVPVWLVFLVWGGMLIRLLLPTAKGEGEPPSGGDSTRPGRGKVLGSYSEAAADYRRDYGRKAQGQAHSPSTGHLTGDLLLFGFAVLLLFVL